MLAIPSTGFALSWQTAEPSDYSTVIQTEQAYKQNVSYLTPDSENFKIGLSKIANSEQTIELNLPGISNETLTYILSYDPVMPESLAHKYPDILTFKGHLKGDKTQTGRFDLGPNGFNASYQIDHQLYYLDQNAKSKTYELYPYQSQSDINEIVLSFEQPELARKGSLDSRNRVLTTYRLAVATTGEYTRFFTTRSLNAMNAVITTINRVNDIFQRDLAIRLELVANNDELIYNNPNTDPFTNTDSEADLENVQQTLDNEIGNDNYDVGHLFTTNGGGIAQVGSVCFTGFKGQGTSGSPRPVNDSFNIDLVAHEIGHQFGAQHTFNATSEFCGDSRVNSNAYELGSGVTIMAYAGICGNENVANNTIAVFHSKSIEQIYQTINSNGTTGNCGTTQSINNQAPVANAGNNYTIPAGTPFVLTATANDAENDSLTYSWEQIDLGEPTSSIAEWQQTTTGPLFRNWLPDTDNKRYLPRLDDLANGATTTTEILPENNRTMRFRVAVRDQQGGVGVDDMRVTVDANIGPFVVNAPLDNAVFSAGEEITVNWQVNQTETLCPALDIILSDDNAASFEYILVQDVENTGQAQINMPNINTFLGKIMLQCSDNIFFNLSPGNFRIIPIENNAPVANSDTYMLDLAINSQLTLNVLANDTDADSDTLNLVQIDYQGTGSAMITDDQILYMPATGFTGTETLSYTISDGIAEDTANVTLTVVPANSAPVANNDSFELNTTENASKTLTVLSNDTDADGDSLTITSVEYQGSGSASITNNQITYTPANNFTGTETLNYTISDGAASSQATVSVEVTADAVNDDLEINTNKGGGTVNFLAICLIFLLNFIQKGRFPANK